MAKIKEVIATAANTHNILSSGTRIVGDVKAEEDIRIDGTIEGNIFCKGKIIIGVNSSVVGNIESAHIDLLGKVEGNIVCREDIILRASSSLLGDIVAGSIEIEPGARFDGTCSMYHEKQNI